jgi:hypothetical protein
MERNKMKLREDKSQASIINTQYSTAQPMGSWWIIHVGSWNFIQISVFRNLISYTVWNIIHSTKSNAPWKLEGWRCFPVFPTQVRQGSYHKVIRYIILKKPFHKERTSCIFQSGLQFKGQRMLRIPDCFVCQKIQLIWKARLEQLLVILVMEEISFRHLLCWLKLMSGFVKNVGVARHTCSC